MPLYLLFKLYLRYVQECFEPKPEETDEEFVHPLGYDDWRDKILPKIMPDVLKEDENIILEWENGYQLQAANTYEAETLIEESQTLLDCGPPARVYNKETGYNYTWKNTKIVNLK